MNRIRVAIFHERGAADAICRRLRQAGIAAETHDELRLARLWFVSKTAAGVRLEVPARAFEKSSALLLQWDALEGALQTAIRCPECRSWRVDYPQFTRKSLFPNLAMGLVAELGLVQKQFYCEACHCMWAEQNDKPQLPRTHMAPNYFLEGLEPAGWSQNQAVSKADQQQYAA
jgi:hypothetical protein